MNRWTLLFLCLFANLFLSLPCHGYLEILARDEGPPFNYMENGKPVGLAVDVVSEIQRRLNTRQEISIVPWARGYTTLLLKPNVLLTTVARTKEREKLFTMIGPIGEAPIVCYASQSQKKEIKTIEDAKKSSQIAVRSSTIFESILVQKGFKNLLPTQTLAQNLTLLSAGRVDLYCDSRIEVEGGIKIQNLPEQKIKIVLEIAKLDLYIAFSRGTSPEIISQWKRELTAIKNDGTFKKIYHKWLPGERVPGGVQESSLLISEKPQKSPSPSLPRR